MQRFTVWLKKKPIAFIPLLLLVVILVIIAINKIESTNEHLFEHGIEIDYIDLPDGLVFLEHPPNECQVIVRAPESIWEGLSTQDIRIWADLSGLDVGTHEVELFSEIHSERASITSINPPKVTLTLTSFLSKSLEVHIVTSGEASIGHEVGEPVIYPERVTVSGSASQVNRIVEIYAEVNITDQREDIELEANLVPVSEDGLEVSDIEIEPKIVRVSIPITRLAGYSILSIIPVIEDQPEYGYRVKAISLFPEVVLIFSSNFEEGGEAPEFIETEPLSIYRATDTITQSVLLKPPEGVTVIDDQKVTVQIVIEPIEGSLPLNLQIEIQGLGAGLNAQFSSTSIRVVLIGPLPVLDKMLPEDIYVVLDLSGLGVGVYEITPSVNVLLLEVEIEHLYPEIIEVTITELSTVTPTAEQ